MYLCNASQPQASCMNRKHFVRKLNVKNGLIQKKTKSVLSADLLELFPQLTYYAIPGHPTTRVVDLDPHKHEQFTALM